MVGGEVSFDAVVGQSYSQYTGQGLVLAWVLRFRKKIIMRVRVRSSCEVRVARYKSKAQPEKDLATKN